MIEYGPNWIVSPKRSRNKRIIKKVINKKARDGQVEHAESRTLDKCELHVPRALQAHYGVQDDGEQDVLRDHVQEGLLKIRNSSA